MVRTFGHQPVQERYVTQEEESIDTDRFRDDLLAGRYSRRDINRLMAAAGIGLATVPLGARPSRAADQAMYYVLGGFAEDPLFAGYMAEHGGERPDVTLWADEEEAFIKLRSGFHPDTTYCGTYSVARWRDGDVLQPIDTSRLTNWNNLFESLRNVTDAVYDGQQWLCPQHLHASVKKALRQAWDQDDANKAERLLRNRSVGAQRPCSTGPIWSTSRKNRGACSGMKNIPADWP